MANATMTKFGYPQTRIADTRHWVIQLRPEQPTLGSLVLVCKDDATQFSELNSEVFVDLGIAVAGIERVLKSFVDYDRINYLMLMMVDPDVHFHVIPRYETVRSHAGIAFSDAGWPGPPALREAVRLEPSAADDLCRQLSQLWERA